MLPSRVIEPALSADMSVDTAIIGAGYTGISAAKRMHELAPSDEIAIIDSSQIGEGNPGRNSGFLLEIALANDADPSQLDRMRQCNKLIAASLGKIVKAVESSSIDCQLKRMGTYRGAAGKQGLKSLHQYAAFLEAAQLPYQDLNRSEMEQNLGTQFYQRGLYSPHCYLAQPAALIRCLADELPNKVHLFENTPAISLKQSGGRWLIKTANGEISAKKVILANNAFAKSLGIGKSQLVAMYTYAGITPVLDPAILQTLGSDTSWGLLPSHRLGSTLRKTEDGRLLVRCLYAYEKEVNSALVLRELSRNLVRRFPQLVNIELEHIWGGAVGFTMNGGAVFGEVKPGLFVSAGCNGGGVVKGSLFGELLADLANGQPVPDISALFGKASWMPPEPIRSLGFKLISGLERFRGQAEI
jgi:glycine/D-amino acid oxidase-like deaminating enzyme|tara:strand:+ start:372 stop:1613 length:1242 start_codon:yes stop_codon:yes gene_type:complete